MSQDIRDAVQEKYAAAARKAAAGEKGSCGPSGSCGCDPVTENLYDISQTTALPEGAVLASLGCGKSSQLLAPGRVAALRLRQQSGRCQRDCRCGACCSGVRG